MGAEPRHVAGMVGRRARQARVGPERGAAVLAADLVRVDQHRLVEERSGPAGRARSAGSAAAAASRAASAAVPRGEHDKACGKQAQGSAHRPLRCGLPGAAAREVCGAMLFSGLTGRAARGWNSPRVNGAGSPLNGGARRRYHHGRRGGGAMDETAIAFELPHARASATHAGPPLDRISVRDYVRAGRDRRLPLRARRHPAHPLQRRARGLAPHRRPGRRRRQGDLLRHHHRGDRARARRRADQPARDARRAGRRPLPRRPPRRARLRPHREARPHPRRARRRDRAHPPRRRGARACARSTPPRRRDGAPAARGLPRPGAGGGRAAPGATRWRPGASPSCSASRPPRRSPPPAARRSGASAFSPSSRPPGPSPTRDPRFGVAATRTELDWALKSGRLSVWAPSHMVTAAARPAGRRRQRPGRRSPPGSRRRSAPRRSSSRARRAAGSAPASPVRSAARPAGSRGPRHRRLP